jgi:hypothetical protein
VVVVVTPLAGTRPVVGDFNVNVGGRHYYGSKKGRAALVATMAASKLSVVTRYPHALQPGSDFGLIDHVAFAEELA